MLTGDEAELVVDDLFEKRHKDLSASKSGKFYESELAELREGLKGIPAELRGTPLAAELLETDEEHDGSGRILFYVTEAVLSDPEATDENREAAELVRSQFIPALSELQDRYLDESMRAKQREPQLAKPEVKAALKRLPYTDKQTLFDVATRYVKAGLKLHELLSDRGDVIKPDRRAAITLRPKLVGTLLEFRAKLRKEIAKDPSVPRDLETRVFGYFDTVLSMKKSKPKTKAKPAAPAPAPADSPK